MTQTLNWSKKYPKKEGEFKDKVSNGEKKERKKIVKEEIVEVKTDSDKKVEDKPVSTKPNEVIEVSNTPVTTTGWETVLKKKKKKN